MAYLDDLKYVNGKWIDQYTNDTIYGTADNDTVNLYGGNDFFNDIDGGNDYVFDVAARGASSWSGQDVISTGIGDDTVVSSLDSPNSIYQYGGQGYYGGVGVDTLIFLPNQTGVYVDLEQGFAQNNITGESTQVNQFENVTGSAYNDYIYGDSGRNVLSGYDGDDTLDGRGGNDSIDGGRGVDRIYAGDGADTAEGGFGNDLVYGQGGNDILRGGYDNDFVGGGAGSDLCYGDYGNDVVSGDLGDDVLFGGDGEDVLTGGDGDDIMHGDAGNDILFGNNGADRMFGDAGADQLTGGLGRDYMNGGGGKDVFIFRALAESGNNSLADWITDFQHNVDDINVQTIDANAQLAGNQAFRFIGDHAFTGAGQISVDYVGANTVLTFNTDSDAAAEMTIKLTGHLTISSGDFLL